MKFSIFWILILLPSIALSESTSSKHSESHKTFQSSIVTSSEDLYNLFERKQNTIFVVAFTLGGNEHEPHIETLEQKLSKDHSVFDKVVYIPVDASDKYQYKGILYDLDILHENHSKYPYFLVIKSQEGNVIRGDDSSESMETVVRRFAAKA